MFYIVETEKQLDRLSYNKDCFVQVIPLNSNYHPILTSVSLIYYKIEGHKGYIFPVNHNDAFDLSLESIKKFLLRHPNIYVLDKKQILYFLGDEFKGNNIIDVNFIALEETIHGLKIPDYKSKTAKLFEGKFYSHSKLNSIIPIAKHYEEQENIYEFIKKYIKPTEINAFYNSTYPYVLKCIEQQGICIDRAILDEHFILKHPQFSINGDKIYTQYNLYNFTSRPSNSFNGINFAALNKTDNTREFINAQDKYLFEFDYDAFHIRIIAKLINYDFGNESVHTQLGRMYFSKDELTEEEYDKSKQLSFKQIYGGVFKQYKNIPFFKDLAEYINTLYNTGKEQGFITLIGGRQVSLSEISDPNPQKLFNYLIQSAETYYNVNSFENLIKYLEDKKSSLILSTYDSALLLFDEEDGKGILKEIKNIMEAQGFKIKVKYGKNYQDLRKLN